MDYTDELSAAKQAALKAGEIIEQYQRDGFELDRKQFYFDMVTEADRESQEAIIDYIGERFPDDGFLAEEDDIRPDGEDRVWVIDPIDGTTNFVHNFPYYCVSIALQVDGEIEVGVVYSPVRDEMYEAVRGEGAFLNGERISVSQVQKLRDSMLLTSPIAKWYSELQEQDDRYVRNVLAHDLSFRKPGSAAMNLCMVASGRADGFVIAAINPWDIDAGRLILEEAGGSYRMQDSLADGKLELVASNGRIQEELEGFVDAAYRG